MGDDFSMRLEVSLSYRVFSRDVTAAMLVSLNEGTAAMLLSLNEGTAAMLVSQTNPPGIEL